MPEIWKVFDLVIENTKPKDFGKWLISESKDLLVDKPIRSRPDEKDLLFIHSPRLKRPSSEIIHLLFIMNATVKETADFETADVSEHETDIEGFIQIEIRKLQANNIQAIGFGEDIHAPLALNQIKERIIETYNPRVLFDFEKMLADWPDFEYMGQTIFDFIIDSTPVQFGNWVHSEIASRYPGVFVITDTTEHSELLYASGELIPPGDRYPFYCYATGGKIYHFYDESASFSSAGVIMGIELRDLKEGRIQAICKCHEYPPLVEFLYELRTEVIRVFNPMYSVAIDDKILKRLDELGEQLADLKQGQITIYQRLDTDTQETLFVILREVRERRLTQDEMQNTLNSICRVLKFIQDNGLPDDNEKIENSLSEIYEAVYSNIGMSQKLELSLPIIPLLLNYKFELDIGVDLAELWRDLSNQFKGKSKYETPRNRELGTKSHRPSK